MFRPLRVPLLCLGLAIAAAVCAGPIPASSQDWSTQERLDRLERDLNMLQRQVYRGAPTTATGGDASVAASEEIRMEKLESQMRDLTGRVEEFANQVTQLRQRLEQVNSDFAVRASQAGDEPGPPPGANPPAPDRRVPPDPAAAAAPALPDGPVPQPIFGTLTPPGERPVLPPPPPPSALASVGPDRPPAAPAVVPGGSPTEQYNHAFGLLKQADYPGAEAALRAFLDQHPKDPMAGAAQYWLGETYYARSKYVEAASAFADGYKRFPQGPKAPEELLKLGMALGHANQKQNACVALAQLERAFPNPGAAIKSRAATEKKHLGCG